ncbi:MAG: DNA primase [Spirochaetaceae bacterium]|nr:DNA primase [Spirochaetaceae bacterium]
MAPASIQEVNDKVDAVAVVGEYVRLEKRSGRFWGCCPFHQEKTPSFTVDPDRKMYYCFGCHQGGNIIKFIMEMDKASFPEAVELLAKKTGVELIYEGGNDYEGQKDTHKDDLYVLYDKLAGSFHYLLMEKPEYSHAKRYILERGVSEEILNRFRLGYAPGDRSWLFRFLSKKGYSPELLAVSGLFFADYPQSAFFYNRLMFPIADRQGRTVAFGGRLLSGDGPKYINSRESDVYKKGSTLFAIDLAMNEIRKTKTAYLAEGYMDVIALHQAGITNAVAPLGTAFTDDQARLLRRWADNICLVFDSDGAGQTATVKAILSCRKNGLNCSVAVPGQRLPESGEAGAPLKDPSGPPVLKDPADILKQFGPEILQNSVKCSINDFEYLINRARSLYDTSNSEGKARAVAFLFPYAAALDSEVSREACLAGIADFFGVERQAVFADYRRSRRNEAPAVSSGTAAGEAREKPLRMNDELYLLTAVLVNRWLYPRLRANLSIEELENSGAKELFIALEEWFRNRNTDEEDKSQAIPPDLLSRINGEALRNFVIEQGIKGAFSSNPGLLVQDSIRQIKIKRLERRQGEIVMELRKQKSGYGGPATSLSTSLSASPEDLLTEKVHIDAELLRLRRIARGAPH